MSTKEEERNGYTFGPTYVQYCIYGQNFWDQSDGFGPFYYWPCKVRLSTDLPERYAKWPEFLGSALLISLVAINVLCFCQPELQTCARISAPVNASHAMDR
jgi:hypothetical protein